ncbi:MAG: methyltransferase domain-containing protein [Gammaproteobacteria bacterium]|nr:MAG: methyltransferase domain-containing protein [Gammaproteobacteria bacterium]
MLFPKNLSELYSGADLATLFKGNFINFGYWETVPNVISSSDVIQANQQLYHQVFKRLNLQKQDTVLELGSGHGGGCVLLSNAYEIRSLVGIDYQKEHVDHSIKSYLSLVEDKKLKFIQGAAESIPLPNESINKIYTIEAFQHFNALNTIPELKRTLCPEGTLVISTFFTKNSIDFQELLKLLPKPAILADSCNGEYACLTDILQLLENNSFFNIEIENISPYIWEGYDVWVRQNDPCIWDTNWKIAYKKGLIDYYIITATKK